MITLSKPNPSMLTEKIFDCDYPPFSKMIILFFTITKQRKRFLWCFSPM